MWYNKNTVKNDQGDYHIKNIELFKYIMYDVQLPINISGMKNTSHTLHT